MTGKGSFLEQILSYVLICSMICEISITVKDLKFSTGSCSMILSCFSNVSHSVECMVQVC